MQSYQSEARLGRVGHLRTCMAAMPLTQAHRPAGQRAMSTFPWRLLDGNDGRESIRLALSACRSHVCTHCCPSTITTDRLVHDIKVVSGSILSKCTLRLP